MSGDGPDRDGTRWNAPGRAGVATPRLLRQLNAGLVLDALRHAEPMRLADLVAQTQMSRPTVAAVAGDLVRLGWLTEVTVDRATPRSQGRPARRLAFHARAGYVLGIDVGEHKARFAVADLRGEVVAERRCDFPGEIVPELRRGDPDLVGEGKQRLALVRRAVTATLKSARVERGALLASCVGCTGGIDAATGEVLFSGAFPAGVNLRTALERTLGTPVLVENDAQLGVLGERWRGVAAGVRDVIYVLAGERLGAGILVGGQLVRGHAGAAGEMAFLGAYERDSGAQGVAYLARHLAGVADAAPVFAAAAGGDEAAAAVVRRSVESAGRAIVTMALVLNPELVVIGGGVANAGDTLLAPLRRQLDRMARLPPRLEVSAHAERGVLVGAIRHALDHVEARLRDELHAAPALAT